MVVELGVGFPFLPDVKIWRIFENELLHFQRAFHEKCGYKNIYAEYNGDFKIYTLERHKVMESIDPEERKDLREVDGWPNQNKERAMALRQQLQ